MSTRSARSTSHADGPSRFQFFTLARELRDKIYAALPTQNAPASEEEATEAGFTLNSMPSPTYLLVSRQFREEYTEATLPSSTLVLNEVYNPAFEWKQNVVERVGSIKLYFHLPCEATPSGGGMNRHPWPENIKVDDGIETEHSTSCKAVTGAGEWVERIEEMVENLPTHEKLELKIGLYWCSDEEIEWPRHIHAPGLRAKLNAMVEAVPTMSSGEVVLFDCESDYEAWRGDLWMVAWAVWRSESGWSAGEAKGRRKVDENGVDRVLEDVRNEERQMTMGHTMDMMDYEW